MVSVFLKLAWLGRLTLSRAGDADQSARPVARGRSPSDSIRLNFRVLEPALRTRIFMTLPSQRGKHDTRLKDSVSVWEGEAPAEPGRQARREPRPPKRR